MGACCGSGSVANRSLRPESSSSQTPWPASVSMPSLAQAVQTDRPGPSTRTSRHSPADLIKKQHGGNVVTPLNELESRVRECAKQGLVTGPGDVDGTVDSDEDVYRRAKPDDPRPPYSRRGGDDPVLCRLALVGQTRPRGHLPGHTRGLTGDRIIKVERARLRQGNVGNSYLFVSELRVVNDVGHLIGGGAKGLLTPLRFGRERRPESGIARHKHVGRP
jgi:hypothetical protein